MTAGGGAGVAFGGGGHYAHAARDLGPTTAELGDAYAANIVFDLWKKERGLYGQLKLWHTARRAGHAWGRDQVARLMKIAGLEGVTRASGPRSPPPRISRPLGTRIE